jgi:hypothetical protein
VLRQLRQLQTRQELKRLTNGALSLLKLELTRVDSDHAPV